MKKPLNEYLLLFKNECRLYFSYQASLKKEQLELEEITNQILNIRSPITDRVGGHQTSSHDDLLISLIEVKNETEYRIDYYQSILQWIKNVIENIGSPAYRAITWQTLIQAKNRTDLLVYYDVDPNYVYQMRDKFIIQAISNDLIDKYNEIQEKKIKSKWLKLHEEKNEKDSH